MRLISNPNPATDSYLKGDKGEDGMQTTKRGRLPLLRPGNWVYTCDGELGRITHRTIETCDNGTRIVVYAVRLRGRNVVRMEQDVRLTTQEPINWGGPLAIAQKWTSSIVQSLAETKAVGR